MRGDNKIINAVANVISFPKRRKAKIAMKKSKIERDAIIAVRDIKHTGANPKTKEGRRMIANMHIADAARKRRNKNK